MKVNKIEKRGGKRENAGRKKIISKQQYKKLVTVGINPDDFVKINQIKIEKNFKNYHEVIAYLLELAGIN